MSAIQSVSVFFFYILVRLNSLNQSEMTLVLTSGLSLSKGG